MVIVALILLLAACQRTPTPNQGSPAQDVENIQLFEQQDDGEQESQPAVPQAQQLVRIEIITPLTYYAVWEFYGGLARVQTSDYLSPRLSFIDQNGNHLTPLGRFEVLNDFSYGVAVAKLAGSGWGQGWVILDEQFNEPPLARL